jgi:hypothetical protein
MVRAHTVIVVEDTFVDRLRADIERLQQILMDVAQHEADINDVNGDYKDRRRQVRAQLKSLGLDDPNPWPDLWMWYGRWSKDPDLGSYQARREFVLMMYAPVLDALDNLGSRRLGTGLSVPATGWTEVDRQVEQLRERYARAQTPEEFRQVGLLCRDIFISLGHVVFDPDKHLPERTPMPKRDDAKNRLDLAVAAEHPGKAGERLRGLARATWDFVGPVVHERTDDQTKALLAADATIHIVKVLAVLFPSPTGSLHQPDLNDMDDEDWEPSAEDLAELGNFDWDDDYEP